MLEALAAFVKAILYAAALTAAGSALARATLGAGAAEGEAYARRIGRIGGWTLAGAALLSAALFVMRLGNYWDVPTLSTIFLSPLGLALSFYVVSGLWLATGPTRIGAGIAAALIIIAFAVSGHAAARSALEAAIMAGHVGAAAWWVGCLWILLRASRVQDPAPFALLVSRFSNQAVWVVGGLVIAGATAAALLLNFTFDFARDYDRGLALKVGLALLLFQVALFNKFALTPGLITRATAQPALRRSIMGELSLIACILAATASLTTFTSPHEEASAPREVIAVSGPIDIIDPWAAATPGGVTMGGGYLSIVNNQPEADSLIGASSPRAARVSLHEMSMDGAIMRMREVSEIEIAAGGRVDLASGHYHLMFEDIDAPFVEGESISVRLRFARRGEVQASFPVRSAVGHRHE